MKMWARGALLGLALIAAVGGAFFWLAPRSDAETLSVTWPQLATLNDPCAGGAQAPFTPTSITVGAVAADLPVIALGRDGNNIPSTPPVSAKMTVAWDKPGIAPGSPAGSAIFNAHTWPNGTALGNYMLDGLHEGDVFTVKADDGTKLCYRIDKRFTDTDRHVPDGFYDKTGPHKLAFIVCAPPRLGPGHWAHREYWYASPITDIPVLPDLEAETTQKVSVG